MKILAFILSVSVISGQFTDKTRTPGGKGSDVVEAVVNLIKNSCIFPNDRLFLRRLAYVASKDGLDVSTYRPGYNGGIWQIDENQFLTTKQNSAALSSAKSALVNKLGIDWSKVTWQDLRKPLYSGLAAAMYSILSAGAGGIPTGIEYQAVFWRDHFRPGQQINVFYKDAQTLETRCKGVNNLDIAFVVDSSASLANDDFENTKQFMRNVLKSFDIAQNQTRVAVVKFSSTVTEEFRFDTYGSNAAVDKAIEGIRYDGGGTKTAEALNYVIDNIFPELFGGRRGSVKVAIIITDGRSENKLRTLNAATRAKLNGITLFTIGVTPRVDTLELNGIASPPTCTHVELLNTYADLDSLKAEIERVSCSAPVVLTSSPTQYTYPCGNPINVQVLPNVTVGTSVTVTVDEGSVTIYGSTKSFGPASAVLNEFSRLTEINKPMTFYISGKNPISLAFVSNTPYSCKTNFHVEVTDAVGIKPTSHALCIENDIIKNCSVDTLFHSPFLIQGPGAGFTSPCSSLAGVVQVFPYPLRNDRFIYCDINGNTFIVLCPLEEIYAPIFQTCVPGTLVIATTPTTPRTTFTIGTTTRPTTPPPVTLTPRPSPGTVVNPCTPQNIIAGFFFFEYPGNDQAYIECYNLPYVASVKLCPAHHYWSQKYLTCLYRDVVINPTNQTYHTKAPNPCKSQPDLFFYPIAGEPTKYIHCDDFGDAFEKTCPDNKIWRQEVLQCVPRGLIIYDTAAPPAAFGKK